MQLRDTGALDLDDRLEQHLDGIESGSPTLRRMLAHISGLQREVGEMFVEGTTPTEDDLVPGFVLGPAQAHHYSNLAFGLLGRVVSAKSGLPYTQYVDERVLHPLGLLLVGLAAGTRQPTGREQTDRQREGKRDCEPSHEQALRRVTWR